MRLALLMIICVVVRAADSKAAITFSGSFEGSPGQGVPILSGPFAGAFDDSVVPDGFSGDLESSLSSFFLDPNPLGETSFDLTSVGATLIFEDGVLIARGLAGIQPSFRPGQLRSRVARMTSRPSTS